MSIAIEKYTEKSIVVRGDTKSRKDELKALHGKWNPSLTDKITGEKFGGWIFSRKRYGELHDLFVPYLKRRIISHCESYKCRRGLHPACEFIAFVINYDDDDSCDLGLELETTLEQWALIEELLSDEEYCVGEICLLQDQIATIRNGSNTLKPTAEIKDLIDQKEYLRDHVDEILQEIKDMWLK